DHLREGGQGRFRCLGWGDFGGEAHQRDAITQPLGLLDLEVDQESKQQIVDGPPSADGEWPETSPFAHDEILRTRCDAILLAAGGSSIATIAPSSDRRKGSRNRQFTTTGVAT